MKTALLFTALLLVLGGFTCKKDGAEKACWQMIDFSGNPIATICDKTEAEMLECVRSGSCGYGGANITSCNYYKVGGEKFCWQIGGRYVKEITEANAQLLARCFYGGVAPVKISCQSCRIWFHREKRTYKPANTVTYSFVSREEYCGDTANTLYQGRQIIRKENADSLIVIQFSNNGTTW